MTSYRIRRRSFLAAVGGALGLRVLLDNLEASAEGAPSPPRLFTLYWPSGTVRHHFLPSGVGRTYTTSRILRPFEAAGLREDMIVLYGLDHRGFRNPGGPAEGGTLFAVTGADSPATRENGGEGDDPIAGGPSFDQIFLEHVPKLRGRAGSRFANAIADARVDSYETSTVCLSYGYEKRDIRIARPSPGTMAEHVPLLPVRAPADLYAQLFSGVIPGGPTPENVSKAKRALLARKSVLDSALRELTRVRELAPSSERPKIDAHADAIRRLEGEIADQLTEPDSPGCMPAAPDGTLIAKAGSGFHYSNPRADVEDASLVERVGKAHAAVIRAAFQCDLLRVASLNWCPGTNHVAFGGMYPDDPSAVFMHHPLSHRITDARFYEGSPPPQGSANFSLYEFFVNVHTWFNQKTADILLDFKQTKDVFGNPLLDHTIVPFVTDVDSPGDGYSRKPALILGGRALGMQGGTFVDMTSEAQKGHSSLWMTIAQAFLKTNDPLAVMAEEGFSKTNVAPISDLWSPVT